MITQRTSAQATWLGYLALLFWAGSGLYASLVVRLPTFEVLSVAFLASFSVTAIFLTLKKQWHQIKQPLFLWVIGMLGFVGNDALFIAAFKHAPAAQADLINYLWPIFIVVFSSLLPSEKFSIKYIIAAIFGFMGTFVVITNGGSLKNFHSEYWLGYLFAFLEAVVWSVYTIVSRHYKNTPSAMIGMYCGCSLIVSVVTHFCFEPTIMPNTNELIVMILLGLTAQGSAYYLWDYGIKKGNFRLLSILSYANPIISVGLLIMMGKSQLTHSLFTATLLITFGGLIGGLNFNWLTCKLKRQKSWGSTQLSQQ